MANYINDNILCQAYIHIDPVPIDESEYEEFQSYIQEFIHARGKFFLYDDIGTDIALKDGSLKVYASIFGAFYLAIAQYGSFRAGVDYLEKDVKRLSEVIISESLFKSKSRYNNIVRVEARVGIIGSLKSIVYEIDYIKSLIGEVEPEDIAKRMNLLSKDVEKVINNLKSDKDIIYIKENLFIEISEIPKQAIPLPKKQVSDDIKLFYRRERKYLAKTCKI
ncbi:MAG: hypothetical protein OQK48_03610 [Sulfurimonas sp.]|uniref:hypothetical protein n=1 Tax=Sulfurimonas sp. TaxID=2022749 RepID=UPI00262A9E10|nr:hypothetical protein [Sulfurimonas sp.]MCW8894251.1 hypothetical protein [Sulfurimonas sp.]MCW8954008.1 hypothetical protein [Sulfurimonas sp.]MCW9067062.1 hypothetical protein [Sulfurimonas sp.]